jgi:hypothetical protein
VRGRTPKPAKDTSSPGICQAGSGLTSRRRDRTAAVLPRWAPIRRQLPAPRLPRRPGQAFKGCRPVRHARAGTVPCRRWPPVRPARARARVRSRPAAAVPLSSPCRPVAGLGLWGQPETVPRVTRQPHNSTPKACSASSPACWRRPDLQPGAGPFPHPAGRDSIVPRSFKNRVRCCRAHPVSIASNTAGAGSRCTTPSTSSRPAAPGNSAGTDTQTLVALGQAQRHPTRREGSQPKLTPL